MPITEISKKIKIIRLLKDDAIKLKGLSNENLVDILIPMRKDKLEDLSASQINQLYKDRFH